MSLSLSGCQGTNDAGNGNGGGDPEPEMVGLNARPVNTGCLAGPAPTSDAVITVEEAYPAATFPNQSFAFPVGLLQGPDGNWYVLEQGGLVRTFDPANPNAVTTYIDLTSRVDFGGGTDESGLLGMAFHPDFLNNGQFFLSYTGSNGNGFQSFVSRFDAGNRDPAVRVDILVVDQPAGNHNGGQIGFGPDGYLYVGLGDGGGGNDQFGNAQDTDTLLGAMLRLDVDNVPMGATYGIPPDNPFASSSAQCGDAGCPEIFAWGLRNPWRWNFDRQTGDLWLGDVGQDEWEEVDRIERGGNYGWPEREGAHCNVGNNCEVAGLIDPVTEYPQALGVSVSAGFVYRGSAIPELQGRLVFADHATGRIWALDYDDQGNALPIAEQQLLDTNLFIASFGLADDGELYLLDRRSDGAIHRIVGGGGMATNPPPALLSATGCVEPGVPAQPAAGLIPYDLNVAFWSDNALKQRWMALPDGQTIVRQADGDWSFPPGSVLIKHFRVGGELVETRLLKHHDGGEWAGYTYEWNDAGTDATLVTGGKTRALAAQQWYYPSSSDCLRCHTEAAGRSLGPETAQMNRAIVYPSTGIRAYQLSTLDAIGVFDTPLGGMPEDHPRLPEPDQPGNALAERARAYLHTNCSQCHRPNGPVPVDIDLRFDTALEDTLLCDVPPTRGDVGITDARRVAPGEPQRSELLARIGRRDADAMPPLGSNVVDALGVGLIEDWIAGLGACP